MSTFLNKNRDVSGSYTNAPKISTNLFSATLAAATEETVTVPSTHDFWIAILSYEPATNVWVAVNATAAVPAGGTFAATTSMLNPPELYVRKGDVLHFITANATTDVGVALYQVSYP